jgi:hypothetical protein
MTRIATTGPANFSVNAALSSGYLSNNALVTSISGTALTVPQSLATLISTGLVDPSLPASALGLSQFGGD